MNSIRRWLYRPKKGDDSLLAHFYFADEELNMVATELDSFDGRKDPERCTALVNQLRMCQDKVLTVIQQFMDAEIPGRRANRDFRLKFPDEVLQESLAGQLWFGAECLAAGSSIMNREVESASMRPLARALTKNLDSLRCILREQCLRNIPDNTGRIHEALIIFDKLFAEFELSYVSAMVPVKTMKEYDMLQDVAVLFSETVQRALQIGLLSQDTIEDYDPALMFTIPRLAIVCGLLVYPEGPLNPDMDPTNMSEMFRPFQTLLFKIRELLYTLSVAELVMLEKSLCSSEEPDVTTPSNPKGHQLPIDQGFDESADAYTPLNGVGSSILVHSPGSGSPVTPVNNSDRLMDSIVNSLSASTIVDGNFQFSEQTDDQTPKVNLCSGLNKSESQDSGLHSENVSTSGTVGVDVPPVLAQCLTGGAESEGAMCGGHDSSNGFDKTPVNSFEEGSERSGLLDQEDLCVKSCCRLETCQCVRQSFRQIVDDLIDVAIEQSHAKDRIRRNSVERQFSWQYNVQFAIPRISASDQEQFADGQRSGSFSSDSTLSDQGQTGSSIFSDMVLDALTSSESPGHIAQTSNGSQASRSIPPSCDSTNGSHTTNQRSDVNSTIVSDVSSCTDVVIPTNVIRPKSQTKETRARGSFERIHCKTGPQETEGGEGSLEIPRIQRLKYTENISPVCSSCRSSAECDCDKESNGTNSETSSYNSECNDEEEIALAIQAAEMASRNEARSRFRSSSDLIHRLFVCVAGVADQLQTNYACDLRHILKCVFDLNCDPYEPEPVETNSTDPTTVTLTEPSEPSNGQTVSSNHSNTQSSTSQGQSSNSTGQNTAPGQTSHNRSSPRRRIKEPPQWVPDEESLGCWTCKIPFTFTRRRHHCRNCGKIFCGRCSSNTVPLPHYGHMRPVRVCNRCFMFQVTPFTVDD